MPARADNDRLVAVSLPTSDRLNKMTALRGWALPSHSRGWRWAFVLTACAIAALTTSGSIRGAATPTPEPTFRQYCFSCHSKGVVMGGISLEQMTTQGSMADKFRDWERVAAALEQKKMPPEKLPQPTDEQRRQAVAWIRSSLNDLATRTAGDPGRVTVRRLTSGEYGYTIRDLTGLDLNLERDLISDEVGGEGFTNFGDVQFLQDAGMERYLGAAKRIADHAVIGSGPLGFFPDAGKTGFELSAIARIQEIYRANGFRTVSGEGGRPFGLERYGKALYAAWRFQHRAALGESSVTLKQIAEREGVAPPFAQHIWTVLNNPSLSYPSSEVVARWRKLPAPAAGVDAKTIAATVRTGCDEIQKFLTTWPSWLFARGDVAAGGAGDERPLMFNDDSLRVDTSRRFRFFRGGRGGGGRGQPMPAGGTARIYLNTVLVNPTPEAKPVIVWRSPAIVFRPPGSAPFGPPPTPGQTPATQPAVVQPAGGQLPAGQIGVRRFESANLPRIPLHTVVTEESAAKLAFGKSPDGASIGPEDFASAGSVFFDVKVPDGVTFFELHVAAEVGRDRDQVFRVTIADRADGVTRGVPVWGLVGDPQSAGYRAWKEAVLEFARILPPNSHGEPTPADKDPIPQPFDNTYNVPEHDEFVVKVKYIRDDRFVVDHILDGPARTRLDHAWNDLLSSFEYHDTYLRLLAKKFRFDLKGKGIADLDKAHMEALPADLRNYVQPLRAEYEAVTAAQAAARAGHVGDCLRFAARAWRRPLTEREKQSLRSFYAAAMTSETDHRKAIRALLARILVAPAFLYRIEQSAQRTPVRALSNWEMASRLSYFLWSSIPDDELWRAAGAGELSSPQQLQRQVKRMLADPKARRLSAEFFGQWLGFYRFDQYRGIDSGRFPEFTDEVKAAMHDEAVSFFEHIIRKDRPVREILHADYTFLNRALARHYGVQKEISSKDQSELVEGANAFRRGGLLRLGAVLATTSAPLRTSPVKRGDWVLRRVLGTPIPPPPADAGSIPADEKNFGGLSLREKLEQHKRNPTCAGCHTRIDPLGFPLEKYDAVGRWREHYSDGKPIEDSATLADQTPITGVDGLLRYLESQQKQVLRALSQKLLGYALGRTIQLSDQPLIDSMVGAGDATTFSEMAAQVAASPQFRNRREDEAPPVVKTVAGNLDKAGNR